MRQNSKFEEDLTHTLLEVRELSVYFRQEEKEKQVLDRVSFQIKRGKFTALMGRSGIGKSLALKAILGFLKPPQWRLEGDIIFYEKSLVCPIFHIKYPHLEEASCFSRNKKLFEEKYKKKYILKDGEYRGDVISELRGENIFAILQGPDSHLHPSLSIGWQIGEIANFSGPGQKTEEREEVKRKLQEVGISPTELRRYPHQFSQGQRQRIMIAMALGHPDLIIADEPTSALDIQVKKKIINLLKELREEKKIKSLLLITHDLEIVEKLFDEDDDILVMDEKETGGIGVVESIELKKITSPGRRRKLHPLLTQQDFNWLREEIVLQKEQRKNPILHIRGLKQSYRQGILGRTKMVLKDIRFDVRKGEFLGIVGESGCGKTTLVKSIARLLPSTQGEIYYINLEKCDLIKLQPDGSKPDTPEMKSIRSEIQVIFQDSASIFNPKMTLRELLSETLLEIQEIEEPNERLIRMREALLQLGICKDEREVEEILSKYPGELSGGEKQRLAIARVFLLTPKLIIADEPFADQDKITKGEILKIMDRMRSINGTTFIILSHDLSLMADVCDRLAVMKEGRINRVVIIKRTEGLTKYLLQKEIGGE